MADWGVFSLFERATRVLVTMATGVLITTSVCAADSVTVNDGSVLVGAIEKVGDGKVVIVTQIVGRVELPLSLITSMATDGPFHITFASGDQLVGTIGPGTKANKLAVESALGNISVDSDRVEYLWPAGAEDPRIAAIRESARVEIEAAKPKWVVTLEGGASRSEGNTDTLDGHGRLDVRRTTLRDRTHFFLSGVYSEQDDQRTKNEYRGGMRFENDLTEKWYWYTGLALEFDEFEDLDQRATATVGVGRFLIKSEEHELKARAGLGYRHESYEGGRTENDPTLDLGFDWRLDIAQWARLTHSTTYSPAFEQFDNYRLDMDTALVLPLKDDRIDWKLGMRNEYNSQPQPGFDRLDNTYYTSLVFKLKD